MKWLLFSIAAIALTGCGLGWLERKIIYPLDPEVVSPATLNLPEVEARRFTKDGKDLMVWLAPPAPGKPTVFYLPGNAGNLANRAWRYRSFIDEGYGLVAPAYRGSSGSAGKPKQNTIIADTLAIYTDLLSGALTGTATRPVLYGESIGTAVTIHLNATQFIQATPDHNAPKAIILEAPLTSIADVARDLKTPFRVLTPLLHNKWQSDRYAPNIKVPLLVLHGTADPLIPFKQGRQIYQAAKTEDKTLFAVDGAGHDDVWQPATMAEMFAFLARF